MSTPVISRQKLIRGVAPLVMALMLLVQAQSASAGIGWCRADPLVTVNGRTGHVYVDSTEAMYSSAKAPIKVEIRVPVGSITAAVPLDNGFGYGYTISFVEDASLNIRGGINGGYSEVRVNVYALAKDRRLPVRVTFHADSPDLNDSVVEGTANEWILTGIVKI